MREIPTAFETIAMTNSARSTTTKKVQWLLQTLRKCRQRKDHFAKLPPISTMEWNEMLRVESWQLYKCDACVSMWVLVDAMKCGSGVFGRVKRRTSPVSQQKSSHTRTRDSGKRSMKCIHVSDECLDGWSTLGRVFPNSFTSGPTVQLISDDHHFSHTQRVHDWSKTVFVERDYFLKLAIAILVYLLSSNFHSIL